MTVGSGGCSQSITANEKLESITNATTDLIGALELQYIYLPLVLGTSYETLNVYTPTQIATYLKDKHGNIISYYKEFLRTTNPGDKKIYYACTLDVAGTCTMNNIYGGEVGDRYLIRMEPVYRYQYTSHDAYSHIMILKIVSKTSTTSTMTIEYVDNINNYSQYSQDIYQNCYLIGSIIPL